MNERKLHWPATGAGFYAATPRKAVLCGYKVTARLTTHSMNLVTCVPCRNALKARGFTIRYQNEVTK